MKFRFLSLLLITAGYAATAQDSIALRRISDEVMLHGTCYDNLRVLCKTVGHRISGSPEAARAVIWGQKAMQQAGADKVWLQPVNVPQWVRGKESLKLQYGEKGKYKNVTMLSLGNSQGTDGKLLQAQVIMVKSFDEFKKLTPAEVKGNIVFFDYRFRQDIINTFAGYGDAVRYRGAAPSLAASKGAVGVIIRSTSTGADDVPHTGSTHYVDTLPEIPAVAIGNISADTLELKCQQGMVMAQLQSECRMRTDEGNSYNVIGEIKGYEHPEQIITVGGHLDSWDVGEGAQDDGAGCVQAIEIIRTFKALGIRPKCTIRAVLFMNEENGDHGGIAYADSAAAKGEQHILAIESDAGGFSPRGFGMIMDDKEKEQILYFKDKFLPYGVYDFSQQEGGTDISPLSKLHVPMMGLLPDSQRYFDLHHSNNDVFEQVSHRELQLGAVVMGQLIYLVSTYGLR